MPLTCCATTLPAGRQYDTIVLDPPAFAKSKQNLDTALRGYKELNLRALKMLRPGGMLGDLLVFLPRKPGGFPGNGLRSRPDAHRAARILESRGQAKDHPVLLGVPETAYLKCLIIARILM